MLSWLSCFYLQVEMFFHDDGAQTPCLLLPFLPAAGASWAFQRPWPVLCFLPVAWQEWTSHWRCISNVVWLQQRASATGREAKALASAGCLSAGLLLRFHISRALRANALAARGAGLESLELIWGFSAKRTTIKVPVDRAFDKARSCADISTVGLMRAEKSKDERGAICAGRALSQP